jgi:hypothetical protein
MTQGDLPQMLYGVVNCEGGDDRVRGVWARPSGNTVLYPIELTNLRR